MSEVKYQFKAVITSRVTKLTMSAQDRLALLVFHNNTVSRTLDDIDSLTIIYDVRQI